MTSYTDTNRIQRLPGKTEIGSAGESAFGGSRDSRVQVALNNAKRGQQISVAVPSHFQINIQAFLPMP